MANSAKIANHVSLPLFNRLYLISLAMMIRRILAILIVSLLPFAKVSAIEIEAPQPTEVNVTVTGNFDDKFGILDDLRRCLINHVDFLLWEWGWDYTIDDSILSGLDRESIQSVNAGNFRYAFNIDLRAKMIPLNERNRNAKKKEYFINYPLLSGLAISLTLKDLESGTTAYHNSIVVDAMADWVTLPGADDFADSPEPPDNMVKRGLSQLFADLPYFARPEDLPEKEISLYLVLDQECQRDTSGYIRKVLDEAVEFASHSFLRQFGWGFKVQGISFMEMPGANLKAMEKNHYTVMRRLQPAMNCLIATLFVPRDPQNYYNRGMSFHVGLSNIGKHHMITAYIPAPDTSLSEWDPFINGLLILHEAGHLMGGVHVYEDASIMYPQSPWVASWQFDRLNRDIIERILDNDYPLKRIETYLELVMSSLERTEYNRVDCGEFLWEFARVNPGFKWPDEVADSDIRRAAGHSLAGLTFLKSGQKEEARQSFYKALALAPKQGAIHYWLSKATEGELSRIHLRESAELGFSDAVFDLMRQE